MIRKFTINSLALSLVVVRTLLLVVGGALLLISGLTLLLMRGGVGGLIHSPAFWRISSLGGEGDTGNHKLRGEMRQYGENEES